MATVTREILTDMKAAIKVMGEPFSPAWFRVRITRKRIKRQKDGEKELWIDVEAYQVDSDGGEISGTIVTVKRKIPQYIRDAGAEAITNERRSLAKAAIREAIDGLNEIGTAATMSEELVD